MLRPYYKSVSISVQTSVAFGSISVQTIAFISPLAKVIGCPVGLTKAVPVTVTVPVVKVCGFPVTSAVAPAVTVIFPVPIVKGLPVNSKLASPVIVTVPTLKSKSSPLTIWIILLAAILTLPILMVSWLPVTTTCTLPKSKFVAENGASANALIPVSYTHLRAHET